MQRIVISIPKIQVNINPVSSVSVPSTGTVTSSESNNISDNIIPITENLPLPPPKEIPEDNELPSFINIKKPDIIRPNILKFASITIPKIGTTIKPSNNAEILNNLSSIDNALPISNTLIIENVQTIIEPKSFSEIPVVIESPSTSEIMQQVLKNTSEQIQEIRKNIRIPITDEHLMKWNELVEDIIISNQSCNLEQLEKQIHQYHSYLLQSIMKNGNLEGNCYTNENSTETCPEELLKKRKNLQKIAIESTNLIEIGFNAGHSSYYMLESNVDLNVIALDCCKYEYTIACMNLLKSKYPERFQSQITNSLQLLKRMDQYKSYDAVHIDGCHLVYFPFFDFFVSLLFLKNQSKIILDDIHMKDVAFVVDFFENKHFFTNITSQYEQVQQVPQAIIELNYPSIETLNYSDQGALEHYIQFQDITWLNAPDDLTKDDKILLIIPPHTTNINYYISPLHLSTFLPKDKHILCNGNNTDDQLLLVIINEKTNYMIDFLKNCKNYRQIKNYLMSDVVKSERFVMEEKSRNLVMTTFPGHLIDPFIHYRPEDVESVNDWCFMVRPNFEYVRDSKTIYQKFYYYHVARYQEKQRLLKELEQQKLLQEQENNNQQQ